ncbi:MAG: hypothetical protein Q7U53_14765 [Anaerolineaceae bacterium]|nr:hypothetical protein [Anaerolineaceae bacterium]
MEHDEQKNSIGFTSSHSKAKITSGKNIYFSGELFYKIENSDAIPPFFMSIASSSNHWLFVSSIGGISAGRVSAEQALFPYYTEDKITDNYDNTGSKTIFRIIRDNQSWLWEPFSARQCGKYLIERNLYKNVPGTNVIFEEINKSLDLTFRFSWCTSEKFGFVKTSSLKNSNTSEYSTQIELVDGLQNVLPANVSSATQNTLSCLLDAYKRSELNLETGLGIFTLNATLTDLAEPSESLLATTIFQVGLDQVNHLLSSRQLEEFRDGLEISPEADVCGHRCAYFIHAKVTLPSYNETTWYFVADVQQDAADIVNLIHNLRKKPDDLSLEIEQDIKANTRQLEKIVSSADGLQFSANVLRTSHHFSNVMFNVMRGGNFSEQYWIDRNDFSEFVSAHHRQLFKTYTEFFETLPKKILIMDLHARVKALGSADLTRLGYVYMPLTFSRRHGDPSRPWNKFTINIRKPDGSVRLDYEGNWRDIFQNWEALAYSYPEFVEGMIFTFLSATTADGFNPYRITQSGLDWEIPEPGNPWANIGYWSDHQIIYLLKLMEISVKFHPGRLSEFLETNILSFANVPYRIKPYSALLQDPYITIHFDDAIENEVDERVKLFGTDGKLLIGSDGQVLHRSLGEKLIILLLAKLVNFVPEGGIWMNTQRPEWNDANNALVGKGLSVVTLGYLRRYIVFCRELLSKKTPFNLHISEEVVLLFILMKKIFEQFYPNLASEFDDKQRRAMMDALGQAGSDYRWKIYSKNFSGIMTSISSDDFFEFLNLAQQFIEHSLRANKRSDQLYHTYNILHVEENSASINNLKEMLEGQVSILSSGLLSGDESLALLQSLRMSALYRADQNTYILYPDKPQPGFLSKNTISMEQIGNMRLPAILAEMQDKTLLVRDLDGMYHFGGQLRNAKDVYAALENLAKQPELTELIVSEREKIAALFEDVFHHAEFTGRSGKFFAYEGLGSVYWHMVSKLLLAVQEVALRYPQGSFSGGLIEKYEDIRAGLGLYKSPAEFGAFPTDPYSHTPKGRGAKQPGMTGVVKEEIITRQAEVGLVIKNGCLTFNSLLFDPSELFMEAKTIHYQDVNDKSQQIQIPPGCLVFTFCGVPIVVQLANKSGIEVFLNDSKKQTIEGDCLDEINSQHIFRRDGNVHHLWVNLSAAMPIV